MPGGSAGAPSLRAAKRSRRDRPVAAGRGAPPAVTDEQSTVDDIALEAEIDPVALRQAREIAAALALPRARRAVEARAGAGAPASAPWRGGDDEIDLDATLERLVADPLARDEDVIVRARRRSRRSVVLVVDVSGSMRGERVRTAAVTVGALAGVLAADRLAVIAFWSDAALLAPLARPRSAPRLLDTLLRVPARGLTNVAFPLTLARRETAQATIDETRVLLLSDCVHNAGPDPRVAAARLPRLDVLVDTSGEHDLGLARELVRVGRGRLATVSAHRQVAPALSRLFGDG